MKTIETKLEDSQHWKNAQETLSNFEGMMELIRQYPPIKPMQPPLPSPPYAIPESPRY